MILSSTSARIHGPKSPKCSLSSPRYRGWVKEPSVNSWKTTFLNWGTPPLWALKKKSRGKARSSWTRSVATSRILAFPVYERFNRTDYSLEVWGARGRGARGTSDNFQVSDLGKWWCSYRDREPQGRSRWGVRFWHTGHLCELNCQTHGGWEFTKEA